MNKLNLHYCYWLSGKFAEKLSVWGILGLLISMSCLVFYLVQVVPLEQKIKFSQQNTVAQNLLQDELNNSENRKIALKNRNTVVNEKKLTDSQTQAQLADPAQELIKFNEMLPNGASLPNWLSLIDKAAIKQHLILNRGDYKLTQIKQDKTKKNQSSRYEIVLPVTGQYTQIRQFIANVLQLQPALALSDLQIKRENTLAPLVEARLVFVLFLKDNSWAK